MCNAEHLLLLDIGDIHAQRRSVTEVLRDVVFEVPDHDYDVLDTNVAHRFNLVLHDRLVANRQQRFRMVQIQRLNSRSATCGQNNSNESSIHDSPASCLKGIQYACAI